MNFHCLSERVAESTWNMMADGVKYLNGDSLIFRIVTSILGKRMLRTHHAIRPSSFSDPPEAATILLARPTTKKKKYRTEYFRTWWSAFHVTWSNQWPSIVVGGLFEALKSPVHSTPFVSQARGLVTSQAAGEKSARLHPVEAEMPCLARGISGFFCFFLKKRRRKQQLEQQHIPDQTKTASFLGWVPPTFPPPKATGMEIVFADRIPCAASFILEASAPRATARSVSSCFDHLLISSLLHYNS